MGVTKVSDIFVTAPLTFVSFPLFLDGSFYWKLRWLRLRPEYEDCPPWRVGHSDRE